MELAGNVYVEMVLTPRGLQRSEDVFTVEEAETALAISG